MRPRFRNSFYWKIGLLVTAIILFVLSYVFNTIYTNKSSVGREVRQAEEHIHRYQRDFEKFIKDTVLIRKLINNVESLEEFERVAAKKYGIFLYTVDAEGILSLNFWSTQLVLPPHNTFADGNFEEYMDLLNGSYIVVKRLIHDRLQTIVAYAMIPVQTDFFLETANLPRHFLFSKTADDRVTVSLTETPFPVKSLSGKPLFYFDRKSVGAIG